MNKIEKCPLPHMGTILYEDEIPPECRDCLQLILDGEHSPYNGEPHIGVRNTYNPEGSIRGDNTCESGLYYWNTGLARGENSQRVIEWAAECDDCNNFVLSQFIAVCKVDEKS